MVLPDNRKRVWCGVENICSITKHRTTTDRPAASINRLLKLNEIKLSIRKKNNTETLSVMGERVWEKRSVPFLRLPVMCAMRTMMRKFITIKYLSKYCCDAAKPGLHLGTFRPRVYCTTPPDWNEILILGLQLMKKKQKKSSKLDASVPLPSCRSQHPSLATFEK